MPELGNALRSSGSVPSSQGELWGGDGMGHPACWELIVTSASCSASVLPSHASFKSKLVDVSWAVSSVL